MDNIGYDTYVVNLVNSFMRRLIKRGAIRADEDSVQIVPSTDLLSMSNPPYRTIQQLEDEQGE